MAETASVTTSKLPCKELEIALAENLVRAAFAGALEDAVLLARSGVEAKLDPKLAAENAISLTRPRITATVIRDAEKILNSR